MIPGKKKPSRGTSSRTEEKVGDSIALQRNHCEEAALDLRGSVDRVASKYESYWFWLHSHLQ